MLTIENISKSYGPQILFDKASLQIHQGERIGLVGRNGSGKTTLFQMILEESSTDSGSIIFPKDYRIGHVAQLLNFTKPTILEEGCLGLLPDEINDTYKVEKILFGLGFTKEDLDKSPETFSGGFQVRLNLAKVLISNPHLLLLDEPTNYLDVISIRWIIKFLRNWKHELIIISHHRGFMDQVTTHTACIHRTKIRKMRGNTQKIYAQIEQDEEVYEKTRLNEERQRKHLERFVERFGTKATKASAAQSKMKVIAKLSQKEVLSKIANLGFKFQYKPIQSKQLMKIEDLQFGYDPASPLIKDFSLTVRPDDRIAIVGKNGKGKSTLIKLLAGELSPQKGSVHKHELVKTGYFAQTNIDELSERCTVEEEVQSSNPGLDRTGVRTICGCMMFSGEFAEKKISVLSGGERSRVMLGKVIAAPTNLLLLDEPTNHLDMQSIDALVTAISGYKGALLMVTHSEMILKSIANKIIVFKDDEVTIFNGSYDEFLEKVGWGDEENKPSSTQTTHPKKELRKLKAGLREERDKVMKPRQREIKALEKKIFELEAKEASIHKELEVASQEQNGDEIVRLSKEAKEAMNEIDISFDRFEKLSLEFDVLNQKFDRKLEEILG